MAAIVAEKTEGPMAAGNGRTQRRRGVGPAWGGKGTGGLMRQGKTANRLVIAPEFSALIPLLTTEEFSNIIDIRTKVQLVQ
jgi:hypothetical protein